MATGGNILDGLRLASAIRGSHMYVAVKGGTAIRYIFSEHRSLVVPEYQRDYAWGSKEAKQLIADLLEHLDGVGNQVDAEPYFLGTIILTVVEAGPSDRTSDNKPAGVTLEIVDGQQRLVTLTILLACLRDLEDDEARRTTLHALICHGEGERAVEPIVQLRTDESGFFLHHVQQAGATLRPAPEQEQEPDETRRNIAAVLAGFKAALLKLTDADRQFLAWFIAHHCLVAIVTARSREQSYRIFTRVNQRGKPLRRSDILKAAIIGAIPPDERAEHIAAWDEYKVALGENFDGEEKRKYLFSYISGFHAADGNIIDNVLAMAQQRGAVAFMNEVYVPVAQAYLAIVNRRVRYGSADQRRAIDACLIRLDWLPSDDWIGLVIQLLRTLASRPDKLIADLDDVERFSYGQLLLSANQYRVKVRRRDVFSEAVRLVIANGSSVDLSQALSRTRAESKIVAKALQSIPVRRAGKAILIRLHYHLDGVDLAVCDALMRGAAFEVEHLIPIRPQGDSDWSRIHGANVGQIARRTGNLFVVSSRLNDALANGDWSHKMRVIEKFADEPIVPLGDQVRRALVWDAAAVDVRHQRLIAAGTQLWVDGIHESKTPAKLKHTAMAKMKRDAVATPVAADSAVGDGVVAKTTAPSRRRRSGRAPHLRVR